MTKNNYPLRPYLFQQVSVRMEEEESLLQRCRRRLFNRSTTVGSLDSHSLEGSSAAPLISPCKRYILRVSFGHLLIRTVLVILALLAIWEFRKTGEMMIPTEDVTLDGVVDSLRHLIPRTLPRFPFPPEPPSPPPSPISLLRSLLIRICIIVATLVGLGLVSIVNFLGVIFGHRPSIQDFLFDLLAFSMYLSTSVLLVEFANSAEETPTDAIKEQELYLSRISAGVSAVYALQAIAWLTRKALVCFCASHIATIN